MDGVIGTRKPKTGIRDGDGSGRVASIDSRRRVRSLLAGVGGVGKESLFARLTVPTGSPGWGGSTTVPIVIAPSRKPCPFSRGAILEPRASLRERYGVKVRFLSTGCYVGTGTGCRTRHRGYQIGANLTAAI